ncbi:MAG: TrkH family potassium uptake protein [Brevinema sp.]
MVYLQSFFRIISLFRVTILSFTAFFLIQGILEIPIPSLPTWLQLTMIFAFVQTLGDTLRYYVFRTARFTYTSVLVLVWVIFLMTTGIYKLLIDNQMQTQTLFSTLTLGFVGIYLYQDLRRTFSIFSRIKMDSRIIIVGSFILVILFGAGLLMLPVSSRVSGRTISAVDALFTAASAVCVTGLTVLDTGKDFSYFGQVIILVLIQIGSLGLVTIMAVVINLLGKSMSLQGQMSAKDSFASRLGDNSLQQFLRFALGFTLMIEGVLALILFVRFSMQFISLVPTQYPTVLNAVESAAYYAVFHAVSSFCNAGFSLFSNSLIDYRTDIVVNFTVMFAIFAGGLGFLVWQDIKNYTRGKTIQLRLQSVIALKVSIALIVFGTIGYYLLERSYSLKGLPLWDQLLSSMFASVNLRTAGFNTTDLSITSEASRLFSSILMYIGASPGSTGGGIKTTTFAVIAATIRQLSNPNHSIVIAGRRINNQLITQAWFVLINSLIWIFIVIMALSIIENLPLSAVVYEVFSAFGTVGVSTGITPTLSTASKLILTATMIIGRVGPSTVLLAILGGFSRQKLSLAPEEDIPIG